MRELYDKQAESRKAEGQKKGGVRKSKKVKDDSCLVVLLPPSTTDNSRAEESEEIPQPSQKIRDIVGAVVGVSGSYIDSATKILAIERV